MLYNSIIFFGLVLKFQYPWSRDASLCYPTPLFFLVTVFSQTLFAFVGGHFVLLPFLTTWHDVFRFCTDGTVRTGLTIIYFKSFR